MVTMATITCQLSAKYKTSQKASTLDLVDRGQYPKFGKSEYLQSYKVECNKVKQHLLKKLFSSLQIKPATSPFVPDRERRPNSRWSTKQKTNLFAPNFSFSFSGSYMEQKWITFDKAIYPYMLFFNRFLPICTGKW